MKIALYGATGMIGQRILREALDRAHEVTAILREAGKLGERPNLTLVVGDALDPYSVAESVRGHDAVVSAYGPHDKPELLIVATHALLNGAKKAGIRRVLAVGGAGSLETAPGIRLIDSPKFPEGWKAIAQAHADALEIYRQSDLDWTYLSPSAMIQPGDRTGHFRTGGDQLLVDEAGQSQISAEDFAIAVLDEIENPSHIRRRFTVGY